MAFLDANNKLRNMTGNDWQLYTCTMKCGLPARAMTSAVRKELERGIPHRLAKGVGLSAAVDAALRSLYYNKDSVFDRYAQYGACDTEPRTVLLDIIDEYCYKVHGARLADMSVDF
jgi:hypothetical protein